MSGKIGALLSEMMSKVESAPTSVHKMRIATAIGSADHDPEKLPIVVQVDRQMPRPGEAWDEYCKRVDAHMGPLRDMMRDVMGIDSRTLIAGNALKASASPAQVRQLASSGVVRVLELDPFVNVTCLDDVSGDVDSVGFLSNHPGVDGTGVRVAVIDSGIDTKHPALTNIAVSVSACAESVDIPGDHATHCAGCIASQDATFPGIAQGVTLLNIKALHANGQGQHTDIVKAIDEAVKNGAEIISMSLGFNHLPRWSDGGHGWSCPSGSCALCTAVDNAVSMGVIVVVAAGNEHERAAALRERSVPFPTELCCPGQAREAITIGAITKRTFELAPFSSQGPTADSRNKPILCAPGVNITSTIPVPRDAQGNLIENPPRGLLFGRKSGTSMATPLVAGAAALIVAEHKAAGEVWTPAQILQELTTNGVLSIAGTTNEVGNGRLILTSL